MKKISEDHGRQSAEEQPAYIGGMYHNLYADKTWGIFNGDLYPRSGSYLEDALGSGKQNLGKGSVTDGVKLWNKLKDKPVQDTFDELNYRLYKLKYGVAPDAKEQASMQMLSKARQHNFIKGGKKPGSSRLNLNDLRDENGNKIEVSERVLRMLKDNQLCNNTRNKNMNFNTVYNGCQQKAASLLKQAEDIQYAPTKVPQPTEMPKNWRLLEDQYARPVYNPKGIRDNFKSGLRDRDNSDGSPKGPVDTLARYAGQAIRNLADASDPILDPIRKVLRNARNRKKEQPVRYNDFKGNQHKNG